ncbi:MAG: tagaturonate epimerase family protein, partial [Bacteroidota bacterium]
MIALDKYSFGFGDRFSLHREAFLLALKKVNEQGIEVTPIWNKSYYEYINIGDNITEVKEDIDHVTAKNPWCKKYYIDADHINIENVSSFIEDCNYFTIDVSAYIRKLAHYDEMDN